MKWRGLEFTEVNLSGIRGIGVDWKRREFTGKDLRGIKGTSSFHPHLASLNSVPRDIIQWSAFISIQ